MNHFSVFYTALGGLGLFFLGLKFLSESFQAQSGNIIKVILEKLSKNTISSIAAGIIVTILVQSSSITSVMTVSLVNAGLMDFFASLGIILGSSIGATTTGWIIALKLGEFSYLFIALGFFPMLFSKNSTVQNLGKILLALGLIYLGLDTMIDAFQSLKNNQNFLTYLYLFNANSIPGLLACASLGCLLTIIVQSSSAMLGITIAMTFVGIIDFSTALGFMIGENVGTTISAQLAAMGATTNSKRVALSHIIFKASGAVLIIMIFPIFLKLCDLSLPGDPNFTNESHMKPFAPFHIAMGHTLFNLINVIAWTPFLKKLGALLKILIPQKEDKEIHKLRYISSLPTHGNVEVSLQEAEMEVHNMIHIVDKGLQEVDQYLHMTENNRDLLDHIKKYEHITDNIQKEVTIFITELLTCDVTKDQASRAYSYIRMADELESIMDYGCSIARYRSRLFRTSETFTPEAWNEIYNFSSEILKYYRTVMKHHVFENRGHIDRSLLKADFLNEIADNIRTRHVERIQNGDYQAITSLTFSDIIVGFRRIKNHTVNFVEAKEQAYLEG